jgi:hypothetical protein
MAVEACCQDESNLGAIEVHPDAGEGEVFRRCQVCGRRHFTVYLEPMIIGIREGQQ